jgi:hypothetical protein
LLQGYAFCEFVEESVTDYVVKSLHNKKQGSKVLTVKRALEGALARQQQAVQAVAVAQQQQHHAQAVAGVAPQGVTPQQMQQQVQAQPAPPASAQPPSPMGSIEQQQPSPIGAHATPQPARPTGAVPGQYTGSTQPASISPSSLASSMQTSPTHSHSSPAGAAVPATPGMTQLYASPATPAAQGAFPPQGTPTQGAAAAVAAQAAAYPAGTPTSAAAAGNPQAAMFQQQQASQQPSQQPPTSQAYPAAPAGYYPQGQAQPLSGATTPGTSTGGYNSGNSSAVSSNRSSATGTGGPYPQGVPMTGPQAKAAAAAMQNAAINGYGNSVMGNLW